MKTFLVKEHLYWGWVLLPEEIESNSFRKLAKTAAVKRKKLSLAYDFSDGLSVFASSV